MTTTERVDLPLLGVSVVDLTSNVAAPFAGAVLADLGADVTHIEGPSGDDSRRMAPRVGDVSAYFLVVNRKKSFKRLDIRRPDELAETKQLIAAADVFLTNLRPAKLEKYGLDVETLTSRHPRLIHGALSAYGWRGEERDRAGYDAVLQARTGIAKVTGTSDGPPVRTGVSVLDVGAGTWLAMGVLAALLRRSSTGTGGSISTSLFETGASWVAYHVAAHQITGRPSGRHGSGHPAFAPYGIFAARDGEVCIGIGGDLLFRNLCTALGAPRLGHDPRYLTNSDRVRNEISLRRDLESVFAEKSVDEVLRRLTEADVPIDLVQAPEHLLTDNQARELQVFVDAQTPDGGHLKIPGIPFSIDGIRPSG